MDMFLIAASGMVEMAAGWDPSGAESKLRNLGILAVAVIAIILIIRAFSAGRKGLAIVQFLGGAVITGLISSGNPLKAMSDFIMDLIGLK